MFGSVVLETFLGLALLFLTLSLIVTTIQEMIAGLFGMRAGNLIRAVRNLLEDGGKALADDVLDHPAIKRLYRGNARSWLTGLVGNGPSYMPNHSFVTALLDTLRRRNANGPAAPISEDELLGRAPDIVRDMPKGPLKDALALMIGQIGNTDRSIQRRIASVEQRLSLWFDESMDRASGWYKRRAQAISLILAAVLVVVVDADALSFMHQLWADATLRETLVEVAENTPVPAMQVAGDLGPLMDQFGQLPLGWTETESLTDRFADPAVAIQSVAGWLITALAVSLGAGFWFDVTRRILSLRASGPKPDDVKVAQV
ncbi:hypothetical protein KX928_21885 [Roseobacter sp. YSTF-M11]|uniref:Uncharacterized protein n=1 Tax=Roseobacter insulae TaxID=2859783 RepID=A0A9X1FYF1_9RHOB|nr:hypothetical protein [Roseobacter insulae]MBW4710450.1 hypothetical protein [Roseobacter insulae]